MKKKMKEMEYKKIRNRIVLHKGTYKEFDFFILSIGTHPTAYVKIPEEHKYYKKGYDDIPIECHGGLTFSSHRLSYDDFRFNPIVLQDSWWIGWDYAHAGDYTGYDEMFNRGLYKNKKWTTKEIYKEVKKVISQLRKMK